MIQLEVKLPDTPGSLVELIKPISDNGGNIYGILHYHDRKLNNLIPVIISFKFLNDERIEIRLNKIKEYLNEKKIKIERITLDGKERSLIIILTGHVFETDIVDTIKRLAAKQINVSELQAKITNISEVSNVKFKLEFPEAMSKDELLNELERICNEKGLSLLRT